ncbi:TolB family protein [Subtercola boreus]|uniref:TolB family protein n=1 Tax=Subtercola boreus TaxID=120213 RepID=UPI001C0F2490|nr:hypothetical protein [Subtercola boreus]
MPAGADSGDKPSTDPSISADGRFVAFTSRATNLTLPADLTNSFSQVYVRDTTGGLTRKLSLTPGLVLGGNENSNTPSISADGSLVAFQSGANNLVNGLTPTTYQVYLASNAVDPMVRLVSARNGTASGLPDGAAVQPSISGDGATVVFVSGSSDLAGVSGAGNGQIYARSLATATTRLLTLDRSNASVAGDNASGEPVVSFDGSRVAYTSKASNLVPQPLGSATQILLFDRATGQNSLVSAALVSGNGASGESKQPSISADGQKVVFPSTPGNLSSTPANGFEQVFLRDLVTATTRMVSTLPGLPISGCLEDCFDASLSADARFVAFTSNSPGLSATPATGGFLQTYVRSLVAEEPTPTPSATAPMPPTGGTVTPVATQEAVVAGQGGSGPTRGRLASTGVSPMQILAAGLGGAMLALVGGSVLYGSGHVRSRRSRA